MIASRGHVRYMPTSLRCIVLSDTRGIGHAKGRQWARRSYKKTKRNAIDQHVPRSAAHVDDRRPLPSDPADTTDSKVPTRGLDPSPSRKRGKAPNRLPSDVPPSLPHPSLFVPSPLPGASHPTCSIDHALALSPSSFPSTFRSMPDGCPPSTLSTVLGTLRIGGR